MESDFVALALLGARFDGWQSLAEKPSDQIIDSRRVSGNLVNR